VSAGIVYLVLGTIAAIVLVKRVRLLRRMEREEFDRCSRPRRKHIYRAKERS
jgi:hypothetical protein